MIKKIRRNLKNPELLRHYFLRESRRKTKTQSTRVRNRSLTIRNLRPAHAGISDHARPAGEKKRCYNCNSESHLVPECPKPDNMCDVCKKPKHLDIYCKFNPLNPNAYPDIKEMAKADKKRGAESQKTGKKRGAELTSLCDAM